MLANSSGNKPNISQDQETFLRNILVEASLEEMVNYTCGCMLVHVMKIEMLINLLLTVEWCCEPRNRSQLVRELECALAFLPILSPRPLNIPRMPMDLATSVVGVSMKCRNHTTEAKFCSLGAEGTIRDGLHKGAGNVIAQCEIGAVKLKEPVETCKRVLHPNTQVISKVNF